MFFKEKFLTKGSSVFDHILDGFVFLAAVILAIIIVSVSWDVVARSIAGKPLTWVLEFSEYSLLYMCFLSTGWVLRNNRHVISDLLLVRLRKKNQAILNTITSILGAIICLVITWFGIKVSVDKLLAGSYQPTTIKPPDFPLFIIIPIGFSLLAIQFLRRAHENRKIWKRSTGKD